VKVALYYPWIYLTSGGERVILELARRSRHQWKLLTSHFEPDHTFPELARMNVTELDRVSVKRDVISTGRSAAKILMQKLPAADCDALFVLSEGLGDFILFRNRRLPSLCYCLTPLRAAFDPVYRDQAFRKRGFLSRLALAAGLRAFAAVDRLAWKRYTRVLFLSREAVNRTRSAGMMDGRLGRIMWTKNVQLGICAFRQFLADRPEARDFRLVVAGIVDAKSAPYLEELRALSGGDPRIEFRLAPSDDELRQLYQACYAVLFTPLNEDLGIVPIEGMAFGKPVIAVDRGGPTETIHHQVQGFLEEPAPEAFARRMAQLYLDPSLARTMGRAGFEHARQFSWDRFVASVDAALDAIAGTSPAEVRTGLTTTSAQG